MPTYFNINYELSLAHVWERIDEQLLKNEVGYICVADGNILQMVHRDLAYREVVNRSLFSICDSSWVPVFLKIIHGIDVQSYCGSQIFKDIVSSRKYRMCFLGTDEVTLDALKRNLCEQMNPDCSSMIFISLPFCKVEDFDYERIAAQVDAGNADIVWVALGAPKQEIFASKLRPFLKKGIIIPVGAVFKFYSGIGEKRAPEWMRQCHLEFLFRLFQDPKKQLSRCSKIICSLPAILMEEMKRR